MTDYRIALLGFGNVGQAFVRLLQHKKDTLVKEYEARQRLSRPYPGHRGDEHLTGAQMAAGLTRALGREVLHQDVPFDVYRGLGFPGAEDLGNMFQFNHDFSADFCRARSVEFTRSINPQLQSFADWLAAHARQIPIT